MLESRSALMHLCLRSQRGLGLVVRISVNHIGALGKPATFVPALLPKHFSHLIPSPQPTFSGAYTSTFWESRHFLIKVLSICFDTLAEL